MDNSGTEVTVSPFAVFRSLGQVLGTLTSEKVISFPQVKQVLNIAAENKLISEKNGNYECLLKGEAPRRGPKSPFIVVEGLDGCGKTTLTEYLRSTLNLKLMSTPPSSLTKIENMRSFFEQQPEDVKRAYYSIGNYLVANEVLESTESVIMDRFWHSTAAYAYSHNIRTNPSTVSIRASDLKWPDDLVKPNLVIFLVVSEKERVRRHVNRQNFTNTAEEQVLAADANFRENLGKCYRTINGVPFLEVDVDGEKEEAKQRILSCVLEQFPALRRPE